MEPSERIDDLLAKAVAARRDQGISMKTLKWYERNAGKFAETYRRIVGTDAYSSSGLEETVNYYVEGYRTGIHSKSTMKKFRRVGADVEDIADYGTVSYEFSLTKWTKPRNQLLRPVSDAVRSDKDNVVGLCLGVLSEMKQSGYSESAIKTYRYYVLPMVVDAFRNLGTMKYSDEAIDALIVASEISTGGRRENARDFLHAAAQHVRSMHHTGKLYLHDGRISLVEEVREGSRGSLLAEYAEWAKVSGLKDSTLGTYLRLGTPFFESLCPNGCNDLSGVTRERVRSARAEASRGKTPEHVMKMLSAVRSFAMFMEDLHPECPAFACWLGKSPRTVQRRPIEGYSAEMAAAIVDSIDTSSDVGKRDLAIVKLSETTGMRSSDIATLRLGDIDWRANEISFVQEKTGVATSLPLDTEAGEALATYLLEARRPSDIDAVFVSSTGAVRPMHRSTIGGVVSKYGRKACGDGFKGPHGTHAFRRGLGARLVEAGVPLSEVAGILGQSRPGAAQPYAAVATERLRVCCAGLDDVPVRKRVSDVRP